MVLSKRTREGLTSSRFWLSLAFFLFCYLYLWLFIKPHLIYHGFGTVIPNVPEFSAGWSFFQDALSVPGGLVLYGYGFLSQGYSYSWLGALLVVLVALCLCELARRHCLHAGVPCPLVIYCFPAVAILAIYNHYGHPLAVCLTLSVGLALSYALERMPVRRASVRMLVFCLAVGLGYWLAGAGAILIFAVMTAFYLLALRRDWLRAVLTLPAAAGIIWILGEYGFYISPEQAFGALMPFSRESTEGMNTLSSVLVVVLYGFVPVTVSLFWAAKLAWARSRAAATVTAKKTGRKQERVGPSRPASSAFVRRLAQPALLLALTALGLYVSYDGTHRLIVTMNALSRRGQWPEVLECGRRLSANVYNVYCNHDIDRALYHSGRLGYDLLCFPQNPHALLLTHEDEESSMTQMKMCDAFIELGNIDLAEKMGSEFLVAEGHLGTVLEKLAWINIIKGHDDTARVYLNVLKKDPIWHGRAGRMLNGLENGFARAETAYIDRIHSYRPKNARGRLDKESIEQMLTGLLAHNPHNRMAFEYLMACYLLAGRLDGIAANIGRLQDLGYREIPTLYEEAMLIYYGSRRERLNLSKLNVNRRTIERYSRFVQLSNSMQAHNQQAVFQQLLQEYGTSYFFYYRFTVARLAGGS